VHSGHASQVRYFGQREASLSSSLAPPRPWPQRLLTNAINALPTPTGTGTYRIRNLPAYRQPQPRQPQPPTHNLAIFHSCTNPHTMHHAWHQSYSQELILTSPEQTSTKWRQQLNSTKFLKPSPLTQTRTNNTAKIINQAPLCSSRQLTIR
jgi:hypothetical protein